MNKRIKKKRELIEQVYGTKEAVDLALNIIKSLLDENTKQANEIFVLRSIVKQNVQATNARFDELVAENKSIRVDLDEAIVEFRKNKKKGLFSRK